jgi:two-component system, OmpR family, sensor histidine kinase ChvG
VHFLPRGLFKIRNRLLLVNALIVAVPLLGIGFARFYEREMLVALEDDMIHQAQLFRQVVLANGGTPNVNLSERILERAARDTRTRVRLIDVNGDVVADSHASGPPEGPERREHGFLPLPSGAPTPIPADVRASTALADRTEVQAALAGKYGSATRVWDRGNRVYLFSALPIFHGGRVTGVVYVTRSTNPVRAAMGRLRTQLIEVLLLALAGTAAISLFLAATISRPLGKLTKIAERISAGDRTVSLELSRRDEIGDLARAFHQMERRLDERARFVTGLAANISHEFKSPLTGIRGAAELLLDGAGDDPATRDRFLNNVLADVHRLDRLVSRLLELSRVESDVTAPEPIEWEAFVHDAADACRGGAPMAVEWNAAGGATVTGRKAHLASALGNLLDNAQAFAKPGSTVTVRVTLDGATVRTEVHNDGPAISPSNLGRIWDRFFTTRTGQGGTGLGLPIVASAVASHGGSVGVESREDAGTTFWFELPVRKSRRFLRFVRAA